MQDVFFTRKQLWLIGSVFAGFVIVIGIISFILSHKYLTIHYDSSKYTSVKLYKGTKATDEKTITSTSVVVEQKIESGKSYLLTEDSYYLVATGHDVNTSRQGIILNKNIDRTLDYTLSAQKLASLSLSEKSSIDTAISMKNSTITKIYRIANETVYEKGDWAIAALVFKGSNKDLNRDTQKIVLQKKDNTWQVTCPIKISISKYECSHAPQVILEYANTIDIRTQTPLMPGFTVYRDRVRERTESSE